jgi:DNA/RNA endonuclease YhcR with UshA esterase domain
MVLVYAKPIVMNFRSTLFVITLFASVITSARLFAGDIMPEDAKLHDGEVVTVKGKVLEFRELSGEAFLDMGQRHPKETFTIFCAPQTKISRKVLSRFQGKIISVTGKINVYQGRPEIILTSLDQISQK